MLRDHGQAEKYIHEIEGYNGRLDAIQGGILKIKLGYLQRWNEKRRYNAGVYNSLLDNNDGVVTPFEPEWTTSVYHLYVIRTQNRDDLQAYLLKNGISTGLHYPLPLHLQKAYKSLPYSMGDFPVSEKVDHLPDFL